MANTYTRRVIYLDTFGSEINFKTVGPFKYGMRVWSIQWSKPSTVGHACVIKNGPAGNLVPIIDWECATARLGREHYYNGMFFEDLVIEASAVDSGVVIITLV